MLWALMFLCVGTQCTAPILPADYTVTEESCLVLEAYYEYKYPDTDFFCQQERES